MTGRPPLAPGHAGLPFTLARYGDCGLRLRLASGAASAQIAQMLARRLRAVSPGKADSAGQSWREIVCGLAEVMVIFDPLAETHKEAEARLRNDLERTADIPAPAGRRHEIGVHYGGADGPDLEAVSDGLGLSPDALIDWHTGADWTVAMIGFTPGFAYLATPGGPSVARLARPRQRVAAGSVGLGVSQTGLYALAGPGGWPLVGRTDHALFDPNAPCPFTLEPGDSVRFFRAGAPFSGDRA